MKKKMSGISMIGVLLIVLLVGGIFFVYKMVNIGNDIPKMQLEYTVDGKTEKVSVNHGTASWNSSYGGYNQMVLVH